MKKIISVLTMLVVAVTLFSGTASAEKSIDALVDEVGKYLCETVKNPQPGATGGEWAVIGLARAEADVPDGYYEKYYQNLKKYLKERGGVLHEKKYTEYSRVILALTAIGKDPKNVSGYNLLLPLGDFEKTVGQGVNGAVWALIAIDSGGYEMPENKDALVAATREKYVDHILQNQLSDGGWSLSGERSASDITAMAIQALAKYRDSEKVGEAIERALEYMAKIKNSNGSFGEGNTAESCAQMIVAVSELGILNSDARFFENEDAIAESLENFRVSGAGFKHTTEETKSNQMATEQCFYALVAAKRAAEGKSTLYSMEDQKTGTEAKAKTYGLLGKHDEVVKKEITQPEKSFSDIEDNKSRKAIEALAERNILAGKSETLFMPEDKLTRAEYAAVITRALGLPQKGTAAFSDVSETDWYFDSVCTACFFGIIKGVTETEFNPGGLISRQEAAVMLVRAAKLCGIDTEIEEDGKRDALAVFRDYRETADWAMGALAVCCREGILCEDGMEIKPRLSVTRAETADMIYNLLYLAELL